MNRFIIGLLLPLSAFACGPEHENREIVIQVGPEAIITERLGPFGADAFGEVRSGQLAINQASELNCGFSRNERCCWHNVGKELDDSDWVTLNEQPAEEKLLAAFGRRGHLPTTPFAATGHVRSHNLDYATLTSCPILCQKDTGRLTIDYWSSDQVKLDVCVLPITTGEQQYTFCEQLPSGLTHTIVSIPPQDKPFTLVVVASEFTAWPGAVAAVDEIVYEADIDCKEEPPAEPATPPPKWEFERVCEALACDWSDPATLGKSCAWKQSDLFGGRTTATFAARKGRTGNFAAGVLGGPHGDFYYGGRVPPGHSFAMESGRFVAHKDLEIETLIWETADGLNLLACNDDPAIPGACKELSHYGVKATDRSWRKATLQIPYSTETKKIFFTAENNGRNYGAVGIYDITLCSGHGHDRVCFDCKNQNEIPKARPDHHDFKQ